MIPDTTAERVDAGDHMAVAASGRAASLHLAFLRGMNLGKRRLDNATLCGAVAALGFVDVGAYRASGNLWFRDPTPESGSLADRLSSGLKAQLGYPVPVVLRSLARVRALAKARPFSDEVLATTAGNVQVILVASPPNDRGPALQVATPSDRLAWVGDDLFWLPKAGISDSALDMNGLERALGVVTVRTQRTLAGLAEKLG
jgi:uncharacterized protein (DUF1697 family)